MAINLGFELPVDMNGFPVQSPFLDWANGQVINVSGSSQQTAVFSATLHMLVAVNCAQNCWLRADSANPTAAANTAGSQRLAAGVTHYVPVEAACKIAIVQESAGGYASFIPCKGAK